MNRRAFSLLAALMASLAFHPAQAQPFTVYDALARVEATHPDLGRIEAALAANRGERLMGYGFSVPTVAYAREGIAGTDFAEQRIVVGQSIASPFATYYGLRRIDAEGEALRLDLDARRALLRMAVEKAFVDVMYAERLAALRTEAVALSRQLVEAARLRESVGEAAGLETMRADLGLAEAEAALAEAELLLEQARVAAAATATLGPGIAIKTPGPLTFRPADVARAEVFERLPALPEVRSAQAGVAAAGLGVREVRGARFPGLSVEVFPQDFGNGFERFGFQIGLRIPIPGTPSYRGARAVATARLRDRTWLGEATALRLAAEADATWSGYQAARAAVLRYRERTGPQSDTLIARSQEGYLLGEVPLFALLDAQRVALAAEERYAAVLRDYTHRLVELERFTGRMLVFGEIAAPQ